MNKLVLNIERVGGQKLTGQHKHDARKGGDLSHIDESRSRLNKTIVGSGDCRKDCEAVIAKHKATVPKNNETPFTRFVLSASPEFFQDEHGQEDPKKVHLWTHKATKFLKDEFGDGLAYAVLHRDETTPHIHAVVVPLVEKKTKRRTSWTVSHHKHPAFAGRNSFERFRRKTADSLGLDYGEPGNKPKTLKQRQAEEEAARQSHTLKAERTDLKKERAALFTIAREHFDTAKGLSAEYAAALKADAKALGRALHFPSYDVDPTTPEAREAVASAQARRAAQRAEQAAKQSPPPAQRQTRPEAKKRRFFNRGQDSR